ncbi:integrin alpha-PS4 [Tribolium castaneum]|uniref:integrin alpha-PS4 n=1 Tax=Tribolium castaneum TaxID=7070 RepID=UPI00046C3131|nr:PREDICTED: integrin alpha-PS4 isoform X2 [Tribolium castaneum]|eukprot:XP_008195910.1 PREDICTED: integrin alpha-PS4 isoform X2 [Tribolium castaneum]
MLTPFIIFFLFRYLSCDINIINYSSTKMITLNSTTSYFGYSILLQKGNPPIAIVGAPRRKYSGKPTGAVFKCNLEDLNCQEYTRVSRERGIYPIGKNGDLLGSVLDGDEDRGGSFFTCAPRFIISPSFDTYFTNGRCFHVKNSQNIHENAELLLPLNDINQIGTDNFAPFYDAAFGESGFSIRFLKEKNELIIGAPGKYKWNGALLTTSESHSTQIYPKRSNKFTSLDHYYGYDVAWGRFVKNSSEIWYVSGAPRGSGLKGSVIFYGTNPHDFEIKSVLFGEEFGSYFGASLLVLHYAGGGDDILVGAPMHAGDSWDEGCVYYYKKNGGGPYFHPPVKLSRGVSSSRFGTVLADLGDIDLDSFPDCAISAPYENYGTGAVYLYFGSKEGFSNDNYQRIVPSNFAPFFPPMDVKGFGLGISKGVDTKNKKHNDFAVGAYKTGQVFYFQSYQIVDITPDMTPNIFTLHTSTTNFSVKYCLTFTYRNGKTKSVSFDTSLVLVDSRVVNERNVTQSVTIEAKKQNCNHHTVRLKKNHLNLEALTIRFLYKIQQQNSWLEKILSLPMSYDCGNDNICQTNLTITAKQTDPKIIILGVNNVLRMNVSINNFGEPAYQTKLYLNVPPEITLINLRECDFKNGSYECLVAQLLNETVEKHFLLDLANIQPQWTFLPINFTITSIGQDVYPSDNKLELNIPITTHNNPRITSVSQPDNIFLNGTRRLNITHLFFVDNQGPSPLNLTLEIYIPQVNLNGSAVFEIESVEESSNEIVSECIHLDKKPPLDLAEGKNQANSTKVLSCLEPEINCTSVICGTGYLQKSSQNLVFSVKIFVHTDSIAQLIGDKNKLLLTTSAYFTNGTKMFSTSTTTQIYGISKNVKIPLWIYICSVVLGLVLLLLLIFGLYKCNFFKRTYKEKIESERIFDDGVAQFEVPSHDEGPEIVDDC